MERRGEKYYSSKESGLRTRHGFETTVTLLCFGDMLRRWSRASSPWNTQCQVHQTRNGVLLSNENIFVRWYHLREGQPWCMEGVFQRSFKSSYYHTTGCTRGTFAGWIYHPCRQRLRSCQNTEGCDDTRLEMLNALNRGVLWLTRVCHVAWCSIRNRKI